MPNPFWQISHKTEQLLCVDLMSLSPAVVCCLISPSCCLISLGCCLISPCVVVQWLWQRAKSGQRRPARSVNRSQWCRGVCNHLLRFVLSKTAGQHRVEKLAASCVATGEWNERSLNEDKDFSDGPRTQIVGNSSSSFKIWQNLAN